VAPDEWASEMLHNTEIQLVAHMQIPHSSALPFAIFTVVVAACGPSSLSDGHATAIEDSVRTMLDDFMEVARANDWDSVVTFYADDPRFQIVEDGVVRYRSRDEVHSALASMGSGMKVSTDYDETAIEALAPGTATLTTRFESSITDTSGWGFAFGGIVTWTLVNTESGWKILQGHTSTARPPERPPER